MGTIRVELRKHNKKSFRADVRRMGQRLTKRFDRRTDANDWIREVETRIVRGECIPPLVRHTVAAAIDRYLIEILPNKGLGTQELYRHQLEWFKGRIGHHRLQDLTSENLASAREELRVEEVWRKGSETAIFRGVSTLNRYFQALTHCLNTARKDWGWLQEVPRLSKIKEPRGRTRFLTPDEAKRLFTALDAQDRKDVGLICLICLTVGSRLQETCALRWEDVDFDLKTLRFVVTKTGDVRIVPLPSGLL